MASTPSAPIDMATSSQVGIKWHPGFGVQANLVSSGDSDSTVQSDCDTVKGNSDFNHCHLIIVWSKIENATKGQYDFSHVDAALAYAKSIGLRFTLEIWWQTFGVDPSNPTSGTQGPPDWIISSHDWYVDESNALVADFSNSDVQTSYAALLKAVSDRYDGEPMFEGFYTAETAGGVDSSSGLLASLQQARKLGAFPHTAVWVQDNFAALPPAEETFLAGYTALNMGGGGPDTLDGCDSGGESWGQLAFRGAGDVTSGCNEGNWGTIDYRGRYPNSLNRQGEQGSQTWDEIFAYAAAQKVDHMSFSSGSPNWPDAATQVAAHAGTLTTACPTAYAALGGCNTN